jgi:hypothetical protein
MRFSPTYAKFLAWQKKNFFDLAFAPEKLFGYGSKVIFVPQTD